LHARPAFLFAQLAGKFAANIVVVKGNERIDGKSILSILTLAAEQGTKLKIEAVGRDAQEALEALVQLVEQGFPGNKEAP
jgi:phosphotransferase system HPr (HPr) family protein